MKNILFLLLIAVALIGCSSTKKSENKTAETAVKKSNPTRITENLSIATIVVENIKQLEGYDFSLTGKIEEVEETGAYPSIAEMNQIVDFKPMYYVENNKVDLDKKDNRQVFSLVNMKKGDKFKATISLVPEYGWVISSVLQK